MFTLKRLKESRAARNAAASYFAFFSIAGSAFLSIPVAVAYLEPAQIGLWTVVNQIVSYMLWMDLGVGGATGRKMADAIAAKDQTEINRWWSATRFALFVQGVLVIIIGLTCLPYTLAVFEIPSNLLSDGRLLLLGAVVLVGLSFPMKGVPGLMTAQERFHWIPVIQGIAPWISLVVFVYLLNLGYGLLSYLWGMGVSQVFTWIAFSVLIRTSEQIPRWDSQGISKERFRSLFSFSLNLSGIALITAVMSSIPAVLISRGGGLAVIPIYNFTSRGPVMISNLVQRMFHAFYPGLQRLYVDGRREAFRAKFVNVSFFAISMSVIAAGAIIAGTRPLVELLAGPDFFGGRTMTIWLAVGVIIVPLAAQFQSLRQIAGNMGKTLVFSVIKVAVAIAIAIPCYRHFGLAGIAAVFMLVPLIDASYGYVRGATGCGFKPSEISRPITFTALLAMVVVLVVGWVASLNQDIGPAFTIHKHVVHLPGWSEWICGGALALIGLAGVHIQLKRMRRPDL
ncbi:MAG: lipopolysaccharide biosynthesis protein [Luteolibacter sp.]